MRIELVALVTNIIILAWYIYQGDEIGKLIYWAGATLVMLGLMKMRG